jgi:hypothetical protein
VKKLLSNSVDEALVLYVYFHKGSLLAPEEVGVASGGIVQEILFLFRQNDRSFLFI